jgi:hypothetical protein
MFADPIRAANNHRAEEHNPVATTTHTVTETTDDLETKRGNAKVEATQTIHLSYKDSGPLEIDLSDVNASALDQAIGEFVAAARKAAKSTRGSGGTKTKTTSTSSSGPRVDNTAKREFWHELANEYDENGNLTHSGSFPDAVPSYSTRGRIPTTVTDLFEKTGGDTSRVAQFVSADGSSNADTPAPAPVVDSGPGDAPAEELPTGWFRRDGQLYDEEGFDRDEDEIAENLSTV